MVQQNIPQLRFPGFSEKWEKHNLQDVCDKPISYGIVQTGADSFNGIPCVRVVDMTTSVMDVRRMITTSSEINLNYKKTILEKNDILFALRGDIGCVRIVKEELVGANITRGIARLSAKRNLVLPHFLLWNIQAPQTVREIEKQVNGSALKEIPLNGLRNVKLYISSSLDEQTKIASFLTAVDERLSLLNKKKELLEQYKKGVMQKIFNRELRFKDDNGEDFPEWRKKKLGALTSIIVGGTPSTTKKEYWEGNIGWLSSGDINKGIITEPTKFITQLGLDKSSAKLMKPNTVLLAMTGATLGKIGYLTFECSGNQSIAGFEPNDQFIPKYLYYTLIQNTNKILSLAGGGAQAGINKSNIQNLEFDFPSLREQNKIACFVTAIDDKIKLVENQINQAAKYKKALLQQMFI